MSFGCLEENGERECEGEEMIGVEVKVEVDGDEVWEIDSRQFISDYYISTYYRMTQCHDILQYAAISMSWYITVCCYFNVMICYSIPLSQDSTTFEYHKIFRFWFCTVK